jgi:iron(III) transport system ATP-binding protein
MRDVTVGGLRKAFGAHAVLTGVNLQVPAGSFTAILGPSGSGKTTLLRLLAGFERADAGTVRIGRQVVDGQSRYVPPERRRIGYVPQEGALFPHLTVAANVTFGLSRAGRRSGQGDVLLETVGLAGLGDRYPHQLSGGQQQRVALARALAIGPEVVLLDEPFASLDAHLRASVRTDVQRIFRQAATTVILVTHDQDEALSMADQIAVLRDGQIAQHAAPEDLYGRPADPGLAAFVGEANLLDGRLTFGAQACAEVDTILGRLPLDPAGGPALPWPEPGEPTPGAVALATVLIRPEQLDVTALSGEQDAPPGGLAGHVLTVEYYGHDSVVRVQPDLVPPTPPLVVRTTGGSPLRPGARVAVTARGTIQAWARGAQPAIEG